MAMKIWETVFRGILYQGDLVIVCRGDFTLYRGRFHDPPWDLFG
jgi:hypothetical protein